MMSVNATFASRMGLWDGTSQLFLPDTPVRSSAMRAIVSEAVRGQFVQFAYTWSDKGAPQEGLILLGDTQAIFADSWHMGDSFMLCQVTRSDSAVSAYGTYPVEGHPDWGWRTVIEPAGETLRIAMFNVPPTGQADEELGFECVFHRV